MRLLLEIKQGIFEKVLLGAVMVLFASVAIAQERVMLITDPHVLASSLVEQGTAMDEMMAGQRKMLDMSEEVFVALIDTALAHKPALVLIPGDLTKDGEMASHNVVVEQLERLRAAGINVLLIPGNHDIGGKAYAYQGSEKVAVDVLADADWESQYAWVYEQAIAKDPQSHSYVAEPLRGVTVLGIDASHNDGEGDFVQFDVLAGADSTTNFFGEYAINDSFEAYTSYTGYIDWDGYMVGAWYYTDDGYTMAPFVDGTMSVVDNGDGTVTVEFDVYDDCDNNITGSWTGAMLSADELSTRAADIKKAEVKSV